MIKIRHYLRICQGSSSRLVAADASLTPVAGTQTVSIRKAPTMPVKLPKNLVTVGFTSVVAVTLLAAAPSEAHA